jgi:transcription elongation factor GreB
VRHLRKRLEGMVVVAQAPTDPGRVFFGAWVELEREDGEQLCYRIVGPDEFDMAEGYISMDAPLARALLGKSLDAGIAVDIAGRQTRFVITAIRYEA